MVLWLSIWPLTGPFYCANGLLSVAVTSCMVTPGLINIPELVALTATDEVLGFIDDTSFLNRSRVFLISGTKDTVVVQG